MGPIRIVLRALLAVLGLGLYVWYAAVRRVPAIKRRKAARRRARRRPGIDRVDGG